MRAMILSGSRNPEGRTAQAVNAIAAGFREAGGEVDIVFLPELAIERCRQCDSDGWGLCRREGRCTVEDDFPSLVDKIKTSDVAVFVNPVYFLDLSESMKAFLDRLRRICFLQEGAQGTRGIAAVGVCLAGGSGYGAPSCCLILERASPDMRIRRRGHDTSPPSKPRDQVAGAREHWRMAGYKAEI